MSDYSDVLYDPALHTHTSCVHEVSNCDCLILIIGPRFGGTIVPKALSTVDVGKMKSRSSSTKILDKPENLSITQLEVIKAIEDGIPIFTFIDSKVLHDHHVYEKNKNKPILDQIDFPSIEKKETAVYIFEFINFIRFLTENNSIQPFNKIEDIDTHLRKQWSGLLQRLLFQQRNKINEERKFDFLTKQIEDIKTAILTTIPSNELKETAKGAIHYRGIIDLLLSFELPNIDDIILSSNDWESLMQKLDIVSVSSVVDERMTTIHREVIAFIKSNNTFYISRYRYDVLDKIKADWENFRILPTNRKEPILHAVKDGFTIPKDNDFRNVRFIGEDFDDYKRDVELKREGTK